MNQYKQELFDIIKKNKAIAMLAPSFPIDFKHPNIIGMLKRLGFNRVTELTFGARMVNYHYVEYIKENPKQKYFIASPCPTVVSFVNTKYPDLKKYLIPVTSPMGAMARIYKKNHKDHKIVFISPCYSKKIIEAPNYKEIDYVLTFKDLNEIFKEEKIYDKDFKKNYKFDSFIREFTKVYPISGGLAQTAHIRKFFNEDEIFIGEELNKIGKVFDEMRNGTSRYRFMDVLSCPGGCISGPAIVNLDKHLVDRRRKILIYKNKTEKEGRTGKVERVKNIDFFYKFK